METAEGVHSPGVDHGHVRRSSPDVAGAAPTLADFGTVRTRPDWPIPVRSRCRSLRPLLVGVEQPDADALGRVDHQHVGPTVGAGNVPAEATEAPEATKSHQRSAHVLLNNRMR